MSTNATAINTATNAQVSTAVNETALELYTAFKLPEVAESDFTNDELAEDFEGIPLNFPRLKIPTGGALQFELPGGNPEDPEYAKTVEGVILHSHSANAYWLPDEEETENNSPVCSSFDGVNGVGTPGGACAACPLNAWGSGGGKGKACKNMRHVYLLRDGEFIPLQVVLSPTSLASYNEFAGTVFAARRRGTCGSIVQIGLKRMNNGKDDYSVAAFRLLYDFSGEQLSRAKLYAKGFREQIDLMLKQKLKDARAKADGDDIVEYTNDGEFGDESEFGDAGELGGGKTFTVVTKFADDERKDIPA